jgi:hypothetical protein
MSVGDAVPSPQEAAMRGILTVIAVAFLACGNGGNDCPVGEEGCACTSGGVCNPGLTCEGGVCVDEEADTGTDPGVDTIVEDTVVPDTPLDTECTVDLDCDDDDPCTTDTCDEYGDCQHGTVDADGDGFISVACGGDDCDDDDETNFPGVDNDSDGYTDSRCGGDDCDDLDDSIHPGAPSVECSTVDNDCNGSPDEDNDGDGHVEVLCGGDDCRDDNAATIIGECVGENECCDGCWQRNGCFLDSLTGYIWEDPPSAGWLMYDAAGPYCDSLSLAGHSAGEWHLPSIDELRTLIQGCAETEEGGACGVTDSCTDISCMDSCDGCIALGGPGAGGCYWDPALEGDCSVLWSSTVYPGSGYGWCVNFGLANIHWDHFGDGGFGARGVRCVHTP